MQLNQPLGGDAVSSCYARVGNCSFCGSAVIKYGFSKSGRQRFQCKCCRKTFMGFYRRPPAATCIAEQVKLLLKEGCGIRSIGRIAGVSATTVLRKIKSLAAAVREPVIAEGQVFEMDELCTFVGSKSTPLWIVYAIDRYSKAVIRYNVGNRSVMLQMC